MMIIASWVMMVSVVSPIPIIVPIWNWCNSWNFCHVSQWPSLHPCQKQKVPTTTWALQAWNNWCKTLEYPPCVTAVKGRRWTCLRTTWHRNVPLRQLKMVGDEMKFGWGVWIGLCAWLGAMNPSFRKMPQGQSCLGFSWWILDILEELKSSMLWECRYSLASRICRLHSHLICM